MDKKTHTLGKFKLLLLSGGSFWLDGGAMFGVVPKPLWNKLNPSDSGNRIELGLNCLLVETGSQNVVIDTGVWGFGDEKFKDIYKVNWVSIRDSVRKAGLEPEDVDIVINSHLHWDHCGGNTYNRGQKTEGRSQMSDFMPSFPKAKYVIQQGEWYDATNPNERTQASYIPESFVPLKEAGNLKLINGDTDILPGLRVQVTGGHTRAHQIVLLESDGEKAVYLADLVPTTSHIKVPYIMGYDLYPLDTIKKKKELLGKALDGQWLLIFEHDPLIGMGYLEEGEGEVKFNPML